MKLLADSTLPLIFLMSCVEIFRITVARPASVSRGREDLHKIQQDLRRLSKLLTQDIKMSEMMQDFERDLTHLPMLSFRAKDLESLQVSSTLTQLYSGLTSFLLHLDWLQSEQKQLETDCSKTQKVIHHINTITLRVLREIGSAPTEPVYQNLPPLDTYWQMHQANMEIRRKLFLFCDWYSRAIGALKHRH